jgi:hypothetical protein
MIRPGIGSIAVACTLMLMSPRGSSPTMPSRPGSSHRRQQIELSNGRIALRPSTRLVGASYQPAVLP